MSFTTKAGRAALPKLANATLEDIATGLSDNSFTSVQLVQAYLRRIDEVNKDFNAVLEVNPDAEQLAAELDRERREQGPRGILHGIPILLKDNVFTDDKTNASAGSYVLLGSRPPREATVAQLLRKAGAILLGKTNLSEWANFRSGPHNSSNGWSGRGGQTYGAYYPGSEAEGSSSGSGVSTILGLASAAIGTETDGSLVSPAQKSNVVAIRATVGLVPRDGIIPLSSRQDTVGPMARTVKCAAHILTAISGKSDYDNATTSIPFEKTPDYAKSCQSTRLDNIRIGVARNAMDDVHDEVVAKFEDALKLLASSGATIVDNIQLDSVSEWDEWGSENRRQCLQAEFKASIEQWSSKLMDNPKNIRTLPDIIEATKSTPEEQYPLRDIQRWIWSEEGPKFASPQYEESLKKMMRLCGEEGILGAAERHKLDLFVSPTEADPISTFTARVGLPAVTVPLGFFSESTSIEKGRGDLITVAPRIPFGITFTGKAFTEELLIRVAHAFEQLAMVQGHVTPFKLPTTELADVLAPLNVPEHNL